MKNQEKNCTCMCHKKGVYIMHIMACCSYTGQQYINSDATIDYEKYNKIVNKDKDNE